MPWLDKKAPGKVRKLECIDMEGKQVLFWTGPKAKRWGDIAERYVVYSFNHGEKVNIDDPSKIVAITTQTYYELPVLEPGKYVYAVTALDRIQNESKPVKKKLKR
jgi:hypothetical protein